MSVNRKSKVSAIMTSIKDKGIIWNKYADGFQYILDVVKHTDNCSSYIDLVEDILFTCIDQLAVHHRNCITKIIVFFQGSLVISTLQSQSSITIRCIHCALINHIIISISNAIVTIIVIAFVYCNRRIN
eukprot:453041_1